jgi:anaphase-promoting complex subunit 2
MTILIYFSFRKRLLIPGAGTMDIINTYISTIKCLRLLDSSGVLLEKITGPFRNYLRYRLCDIMFCKGNISPL